MTRAGLVAVGLAVLTLLLGGFGWWGHPDIASLEGVWPRMGETLYRSVLAFGGDEIYLHGKIEDDALLSWARFTGLAATITAIGGLLLGVFRDAISRFRASGLSGHEVLVGSTDFSFRRAEMIAAKQNRRLTVLDDEARIVELRRRKDAGTTLIASGTDRASVRRYWGSKPARVSFGDASTDANIERARLLAPDMPKDTRIELRVEESAIARDLGLVAPELDRADLYSAGEIVARSFIAAVDAPDMLRVLGQRRLHVAFVGMGRFGVALAEEIVLSWGSLSEEKPLLHIVDIDVAAARCALAKASPHLHRIAELKFLEVDTESRGGTGEADLLLAADAVAPLTAIVVSTGNDARNLGIGLRLRQVQNYGLRLKARIFVRDEANACMGPDRLDNLNTGISFFGGRLPRNDEASDQVDRERLARTLHEIWVETLPEEDRAAEAWDALPHSKKLTNHRAAASTVTVLRLAGLCPPSSGGMAGYRAHAGAVAAVQEDTALMERLAQAEHDRWMHERIAEGWTLSTTGYRDDEKKRHILLRSWEALDEDAVLRKEKDKDYNNIHAILERAARMPGAFAAGRCWRRRLRVGVVGRLSGTGPGAGPAGWQALRAHFLDQGEDLEALSLEVLSPLAPGFDREGAVALMRGWREQTGRRARLLFLSGASLDWLDRMAVERVAPAEAMDQRKAVLEEARDGMRHVDMRPEGVSNKEIDEDRKAGGTLFPTILGDVERRLADLSDIVVVAAGEGDASRSARFARMCEDEGKPVIRIP